MDDKYQYQAERQDRDQQDQQSVDIYLVILSVDFDLVLFHNSAIVPSFIMK